MIKKWSIFVLFLLLNCSDFITKPEKDTNSTDNNSTIQNAIQVSLDTHYKFKIDRLNDTDYYKINLPVGGLLRISCTNVPQNIDLYLEVQDVEMNSYAEHFANKGQDVLLTYSALSGTYYIMIKDGYNTDYSSQEITLLFEIDSIDIFENNNSLVTAKRIELNQLYSAKIIPIKDIDY